MKKAEKGDVGGALKIRIISAQAEAGDLLYNTSKIGLAAFYRRRVAVQAL